jgi:hypothetical protein
MSASAGEPGQRAGMGLPAEDCPATRGRTPMRSSSSDGAVLDGGWRLRRPMRHERRRPAAGESEEEAWQARSGRSSEPQRRNRCQSTLDSYSGVDLAMTASKGSRATTAPLGYFGYWEGSPDDAQHMVESPRTVEPTAHVSGVRLAPGARRLCPCRCDRLSPIDSAPNGCETGSEGGSLTTPSEFLVRRPRPSWALEPDGLDDPRELLNLGGCGLGQHSTR